VKPAYYNEFDPYAAAWLRNLISAGHLPQGDVDERSIVDVQPDDLAGYMQCHFFAGIGGWALAARLAGWPDDRQLWTGSCPCQPFSVIGQQEGVKDERHLWPEYFRLIRAHWPAAVMGEQVAAAIGKTWLDGVLADLESIGYAGRAVVLPACSVDAPHRRDRVWFVADGYGAVGDGERARLEGYSGHVDYSRGGAIPHRSVASTSGGRTVVDANVSGPSQEREQRSRQFGRASGNTAARSAWGGADWIIGHDGKARRVEPSIRLLAHGVPARVGRLRAYGNAIVPQVAAEVIAAYMDCTP
jgi:DNA (cytosine-5)-methyltransferase 1